MFEVARNIPSYIFLAATLLSLLCSGCGGGSSSNTSGSNNLSQAQAQAVTGEVSLALAQALGNTFTPPVARDQQLTLPAILAEIHPDASSPSCTPTSTGEDCNWPITYSGPCPQAGTIAVAGDISGSLNNSGGGSILTLLTITPLACSVSGLVLNGDPSITVDGQINFSQTAPVFPITLSETGGISYGSNPSGSCKFNVTYTVTSATAGTIAGTACGQSVNGPC
jgi:hypothetical protein